MWKPIYQPEPWPQFVKRKDIKGLPLMEQRKKFLQEQLLFENYLSTLNTVNTVSTLSAGAAGGPAPSTGGGGGTVPQIVFKINTNLQAPSEFWTTGSDFYQQNNIVHLHLNDVSQFWFNGTAPTSTTNIDWGDGNVETGVSAYNTWEGGSGDPTGLAGAFNFPFQTYTHSYDSNGEYTVTLSGDNLYNTKLAWLPITEVLEYDNTQLSSYQALFLNAQISPSLNDFVADWNTSNATDLTFTFANVSEYSDNFSRAVEFFTSSWNPNVENWDVSNVTTLNRTFMGMQNFNRDLSSWNTSNVGSIVGAFWGCLRLVSGGRVDQWDTSGFNTINGFSQAFKSSMRDPEARGSMPHVGGWDLSTQTSLNEVFSGSGFSHTAVGETLIGWSSGSINNNINASKTFASTWDGSGFSNPVFNTGSAFGLEVSASYNYLVTTRGWTITDITFT